MDSWFRKVEPGEKIEPPKEFEAWASNTMAGFFAGMLFGGVREAIAPTSDWDLPSARSSQPATNSGPTTPASGTSASGSGSGSSAPANAGYGGRLTRQDAFQMQRDLMEKRFVRICRGSIVGAGKLGAFAGVFCGLQTYFASRGSPLDPLNTIAAGGATAASFGVVLRGSIPVRVQRGAFGAVFGSVLCAPLAYLHSALQASFAHDVPASETSNSTLGNGDEQTHARVDGIGKAISKLEQSLALSSSSPSPPSSSSSSTP